MGETSMLEQFMPPEKNGGSHNHHFLGDIGRWFINHIAGLNIVDHKSILVKPQFISDIDYARASYKFPSGEALVSWKRDGDEIILSINCDAGISYEIELTCGYVFEGNKVKKVD
jgi:alpha-L-rhamnosidase